MKSITLKILASDIMNSNFTCSADCAITRAFGRAGFNYKEAGGEIKVIGYGEIIMRTPEELSHKVQSMYAFKTGIEDHNFEDGKGNKLPLIEPADFDYEITVP